jgi:hypothetical protein
MWQGNPALHKQRSRDSAGDAASVSSFMASTGNPDFG